MSRRDSLPKNAVARFNTWVGALRTSPRWGPLVRRHLTEITYTGRRSGHSFSTPVGYRRAGDVVTIRVMMPDAKSWWRNFTGDGAPLTLELDATGRTGHAVARRDEKGRVTVTVHLDGDA
ncbi:hypothetical protein DMA12_00305 [Amycolatopsis balhimycina DSM 5908]|uniref:DUF385 domain-containing protein n=1 Tax=Amycolatopsis balhimycina DSM 5908 TaxID=1081091 RepID=A0A428X5P7_AMYBA|nr:hypothetical protein [Amycolatopsis balhimycina]RSM50646.1 hypothetical protein DMA12_00305 [Amycolatopsis balhimycina DSM 5908]